MKNTAPHYLLITEAKTIIDPREGQATPRRSGRWRFVLEQMGVEARIEVADDEPNVFGERLELLAVVRGLEALEQLSRVTLLTSSRYVGRGIRQGMQQWRTNDWRWERFGKLTLVKNHDLWRRVDHALQFHSLECRIWDLSRLSSHATAAATDPVPPAKPSPFPQRPHFLSHANQPKRRSNVIRPHGDNSATDRKPVEPLTFSDRQAAIDSNNSGIQAPEATAVKSVKIVSSDEIPNGPAASLNCSNHQRTECIHDLNQLARVKPPREGRAYGYAVN